VIVRPVTAIHRTGRSAGGFSLAELMIALAILGLGLLFIAAALPAGIEYSRRTVDAAQADAAADFAISTLKGSLRTSRYLVDAASNDPQRLDSLVVPRDGAITPQFPRIDNWEPIVKVRPLVMGNIGADSRNRGAYIVDDGEALIGAWLSGAGLGIPPGDPREYDVRIAIGGQTLALAQNPSLSPIDRVYPPVDFTARLSPQEFFGGGSPDYPRIASLGVQQVDLQKMLDRRIGWTVLYRRVSWAPDADRTNYELIVIVTQRPSTRHRFAFQDPSAGFNRPGATAATGTALPPGSVGADRAAPTPWLVTFRRFPNAPYPATTGNWVSDGATPERLALRSDVPPPTTLEFECTEEVFALMPEGSVFIPARNDFNPGALAASPPQPFDRVACFPTLTDSTPVYEVKERVERNGRYYIVVKNEGFYPPFQGRVNPEQWPVWVIPPSFETFGPRKVPNFDRRSPVLKVVRVSGPQYVREIR